MSTSSVKYSPVRHSDELDDGSAEKLLGLQSSFALERLLTRPRPHPYLRLLAHGALFSLYTLFFIVFLRRSLDPTPAKCDRRFTTYSPANDAIEYHDVYFNGTFEYPSEYRGEPNPQLDAAWERLMFGFKQMSISKATLARIGKEDVPSLVKFREEDGGGYLASLEVSHQLHCLNLLRMTTWRDYYESFYASFQAQPETLRTHIDHCVEILRQKLMCRADTGLITYHWVKGYNLPYPDFNTRHTCRDFEKIFEWNQVNAIHVPEDHNKFVRWGVDEVDLPFPP